MRWMVGLVAALLIAMPVFAQKFPNKPVTMIVPYPPGGSNDTFARELGRRREGAEPATMTPAQFAKTIKDEIEGWKKVAKAANIKAE